ncbi:MAG: hypothetical protein NT140_04875 [Deltaproteobacteria bacterium]|nr:hypothetical protein [Deltaproteobacteria bacterium]
MIPEIHSNINNVFSKRSPIGIYDKTILCEKCDQYLGILDGYAQKLLIQDFSEELAVRNVNTKMAYKIDKYDYKKLKLFFLSVLWRASISSQSFYRKIEIGAHENIIKGMIRYEDPGEPFEYSVSLAKFSDPRMIAMLDPHKKRLDGINYCQIYMTGFVVYIKVDKREPPVFLRELCLSKDPPFWIILRDLNNSKDGKIIKEIASKAIRHQ